MAEVRIKACLFDMDGLLIDSERIYTETTELLLARHGKDPRFPVEVKSRMMGRPGPDAARVFLDWAGIEGMTVEDYGREQRELQLSRFPHVKPMPGALDLIERLYASGVPIALATSSTSANYALKSTNLREFFGRFGDAVVCGDDPRVAGKGKPRPDIFLHALGDLNRLATAGVEGREDGETDTRKPRTVPDEPLLEPIQPEECLVFEDGVPGVQAGLAAGMRVVWVPDPAIAALHQNELDEIVGTNGQVLDSLEDFDYAKYGLDKPGQHS